MIQRVDPAVSLGIKPTRMAEAPLRLPPPRQPFIRTLAPLYDQSAVISLTRFRLHGAAVEL